MSADGGATRRSVLFGAGAVCAAGILGACGADQPSSGSTPPDGSTTGPPRGIPISDIPVGGGVVVGNFVVTQPTEGDFRAFNRTCPHQGNPVGSVIDGLIVCPFHGSEFDFVDGSVVTGPATRGLTVRTAVVTGDVVFVR